MFDVVYHAVKLALAQPGTGERRFTFEADKNEKSEKENDTKNENTVKNNHLDVYKRQEREGEQPLRSDHGQRGYGGI